MWGFGLVMGIVSSASAVEAGACGLVGAGKVDFSEITAVSLRGIEANVEVLPADTFEVRQGAAVCASVKGAPVEVRLVQKGTVLIATVAASDKATKLTFAVPRTLEALTVDHQVGALVVRDLPARVAVISNTGLVEVSGAQSLRVAYGKGDVVANRVESDVSVDNVAGNLTVEDVAGALATSNVTGTVVHENVRGQVSSL